MKKSLIILAALALSACATKDSKVTMKNGETSGLDSRDAAWALATKSSNDAVVDLEKNRKPQCEIDMKGTITDLKFSCYGDSKNVGAIQRVERPKSEFSENVGAIADGTVKVLGAATPIVTIREASKVVTNGQNAALESQRLNASSSQSIATQGIDAAGKDPIIVGPSEGFTIYGD